MTKERLEVFSNGITAVVDDFKELHVFGKRHSLKRGVNQNKGHKTEVEAFLNAVKDGSHTPIVFEEIYWSTKMSFDVLKSIRERKTIVY